jgi:hypothetical protein
MVTYPNQPLEDIDDILGSDGWVGGWRVQEDAAHSISSTLASAPYFFEYLPFVFIVETSTMRIVAADSGDTVTPVNVDILGVVQGIDAAD